MKTSTVRVYELANELNLSVKDALSLLQEGGFGVTNNMSIVPVEGIDFLRKKMKSKSPQNVPSPSKLASKPEASRPAQQVPESSASQDADLSSVLTPRRGVPARTSIRYGAHSVFTGEEYVEETDASSLPGARPFRRRRSGARRNRSSRQNNVHTPEEVTEITVSGGVALGELATMMGKPSGAIILELLKKGVACTMNDIVSVERIQELGDVFDIDVHIEAPSQNESEGAQRSSQIRAAGSNMVRRWPVVVVMGHVDHGKTTLLDYLRKTSVAAKEKGGITQHLGAYEVESTHGKIVFIDTPGHAAFTALRDRGVSVTDLVVLIVAVDDGVKPQTLEALRQAQKANLPIVVAVNKIDKPHSPEDLDRVKRQLAEHGVLAEEWGGSTVMVGISAKTGQGVDELLEMIVLQTQLMDIFADVTVPAKLFVLESRMDRGFGSVATVIPLCGTLKVGDCLASDYVTGKVRLLVKPSGDRVAEVGPSIPVQVIGCNALPEPGDVLTVVTPEEYARAKNAVVRRSSLVSSQQGQAPDVATQTGDEELVRVIVKTDAQGSADAIMHLIGQLSDKDAEVRKRLRVIYCTVGDVTETDIQRSLDTNAMIIAFNVRVDRNALEATQDKKVVIKPFDVIYHLTEFLEAEIVRTKKAVKVTKRTGQLEVRKIFVLKDKGIIAGCYVTEGSIHRNGHVVCMRGKQKMGSDEITSLQRDKKSAKEIVAGYECAFMCKTFHDWQVGDIVECYVDELV